MAKQKKPARRKLTRSQKLRKILTTIEDVLLGDDTDLRTDLWNVLTALRGPDTGDINVKTFSTCLIRMRAFPRIARSGKAPADFVGVKPFSARDDSGHFNAHAWNAWDALRRR